MHLYSVYSLSSFVFYFMPLGNYALGRDTWIISIENDGASHRAVDGDKSKNWGSMSCTATRNEQFPWWAVSLGEEKKIGRVEIISRNVQGAQSLQYINLLPTSLH